MTSVFVEHAASSSLAEVESSAGHADDRNRAGENGAGHSNPISGLGGIASAEMLREAALSLDVARRDHGGHDGERAVLLWEGLLRGKVKLVDWFDSNGRRFIMMKLNSAAQSCGCGLTAREYEVTLGAALGESSKATGYRLGISPSRVSALLKGSMRKLGVKTKAQLVIMVRVLGRPAQEV